MPSAAAARQADDVLVLRAVAEVGDHDYVVARPAALPAAGELPTE
jgi:hypothetical protein